MIENLLLLAPPQTVASYYRTSAGAEIDLVLEVPKRGRWAIEVKSGLSPRPAKGFYLACEDIQPTRQFVVYAGHERYPLRAGLEAIGLAGLASELA